MNAINKLTDMNNKYTQLWFLPENNIKAIEHNLMSILLQDFMQEEPIQ